MALRAGTAARSAAPLAVATANYVVPLHVPFVPDLALHFSAESVAPAPDS